MVREWPQCGVHWARRSGEKRFRCILPAPSPALLATFAIVFLAMLVILHPLPCSCIGVLCGDEHTDGVRWHGLRLGTDAFPSLPAALCHLIVHGCCPRPRPAHHIASSLPVCCCVGGWVSTLCALMCLWHRSPVAAALFGCTWVGFSSVPGFYFLACSLDVRPP